MQDAHRCHDVFLGHKAGDRRDGGLPVAKSKRCQDWGAGIADSRQHTFARIHHFKRCLLYTSGAVIAVALIALIVWLMARKGYDPSKKKETLSAVEANS